MTIRVKRVADASKVFVFVAVVAGLDPLGMSTVELLAELLAQPVALDFLLVEQYVVINNDHLLNDPVFVDACEVCH